jgi:penicillin V acylase-like amidase (Ntn superfamily)
MGWKAIYGQVGMNQSISKNSVSDGMNKQKWVVGMLYLSGYAK